jgi:hypothetical protein
MAAWVFDEHMASSQHRAENFLKEGTFANDRLFHLGENLTALGSKLIKGCGDRCHAWLS